MSAKRAAISLLVLVGYLTLWMVMGFIIAVFSTNPPPPIPGHENMVAFGRYCAFGIGSLLIGLFAGRSLSRAFGAKGTF